MDDRDAVASRIALPDAQFVQAAELLERGGLPGGPFTGDDEPAAGAVLALVEQGQLPSLVGDVLDRGRAHDLEFGVVGDAASS
ncbi:hypothetical protein PV728_37310 [Streptomyces europaeiscabiei]|uniref:hypothetical protein n=1 Tax=Streptomyces TaxID=1883 RepID=UPI0015C4F5C7|nr:MULTISPECIES: hypothetical protein [Streptomyces]MDX3635808.1 hypothetical protein [Streptomyces europaeiscabiei]